MIILSPDFKDFLRLLNEHEVAYLLVGGYAVALHGYVRYTSDMDIWVLTTPENADRVVAVLKDFGLPEIMLMASGSEVGLIMEAAQKLFEEGKGVRVVSFPSWELFEKQDEAYRESVLPKNIQKRLAVEAGSGMGWERYAKSVISIERYGASAPYKIIFEHLGFTVENVIAKAKAL